MNNWKDRLFIPAPPPTPKKKSFQRFLERLQSGLARKERQLSGNFQFTRTLLLVLPCGNQKIILDFPHIQKKGQL